MGTKKAQAVQCMKEARYTDAIPLLLQLEKDEIKDWTLYYAVGKCYRFAGDLASAYQFLETAKQINSVNEEIAYAFAEVCELRLQYADAISAYEDVLSLYPDRIAAYNKIGLLYIRMNRMDEAMKWFQKGMEQITVRERAGRDMRDEDYQDKLKAKMELGYVFPYTKAEDTMDLKLIKVVMINSIGVCYLEQQEREKAKQYFKASLSLLPEESAYTAPKVYMELLKESMGEY
jgi:tetratricopeptide (TPR) repeat protein